MFQLKKVLCILIIIPFICSAKEPIKNAIKYDNQLNIAYKNAIKQLSKNQKTKLKKAQRLWIKYRNAICEFEGDLPNKGHWIEDDISNSQSLKCISRLSIARTKELNEYTKSIVREHIDGNQSQKVPIFVLEMNNKTKKLNLKGELYYANKEYEAAYQAFEKAIQLNSNNIRALNNLSITSLKLGKTDKALTATHRIIFSLISSSEQKATALFNMGLACEGTGRRWIKAQRKWFCQQSSLELYTQSFLAFPTKNRSKVILKKFTSAKAAMKKCQLNDGLHKSYFKRSNKFIFLHGKGKPDLLSGSPNENPTYKINLKRTETRKLINGLYISTFWATSSKNIKLNKESCKLVSGAQKSDSLNDVALEHIGQNHQAMDTSVNLEKFSNVLIKNDYNPCENIDYCFNGILVNQITFEATSEGLIVAIPSIQIPKHLDIIKELSKIERLLEDGTYIRKMCKKSKNTWIYGLVTDKCPAI